MRVNDKILSIPPYISTSWNNITSLRMKDSVLIIQLEQGDLINIPALDEAIIQQIFSIHANKSEESENLIDSPAFPSRIESSMDFPFKLGVGIGSVQDIGSSILQHDPAQINSPKIPQEILEKIISITKIVSPEGLQVLSKPEENCNCVHCQIAQALTMSDESIHAFASLIQPETVTPKDLTFQQWDIKQTSDHLFSVTNKLDSKEHYSVFLGEPIGCTCGKTGCDHIVAVLKS